MKQKLLILTAVVGCVLVVQLSCGQLLAAEEGAAAGSAASKAKVGSEKAVAAPKKAETAKPDPNDPNQPTITFEKPVNDFGQVSPRSKNRCEFKFTNTGKGVLKIGKIKSTCGCTVPKLSKLEYAPGESGAIKVTYSTSSHAGMSSKKIYVNSNDTKNPKVRLTVKATVVVKVEHSPKSFRLSFKNDNTGLKPITLRAVDKQEFSIKSFKSTSDCITAVFDPNAKADKFVLQPKADMEKLKTLTHGTVDIGLTHPDCKKINIRFSVQKRFTISPPTISLYDAKPGKVIKRKVWIINNFGEDFEVESTASKTGYAKVLSQEKVKTTSGGTRYKFDVEITAPADESKPRFMDEITITTKDGEKLKVKCRGFFKRKGARPSVRSRKPSGRKIKPLDQKAKPSSRQK